ncbi:D-Ala-D-Ala carboxypeptidase VanY [Cohnella panacarvi]|uniref:D-Ala-D-Ala carboxypeptidase VanY n=1 Tax=Cohnella panacarvi TaxID=400776 RepID=UPI00047C0F68
MNRGLLLLLAIGLLAGCGLFRQDREVSINHLGTGGVVGVSQGSTKTIQISKDQIYKGNLILVNKTYPLHKGSTASDIVNLYEHRELLDGFGLLNDQIRLPTDLVQRFSDMVAGAAKDGVDHFLISSGYRDRTEQNKLYEEKGSDYALPAGHSEHNLGLSLDIGSSLAPMNEAPEGKWLKDNASDYGFILRYPKNKTKITGIQYEPWHFRYVGLPHSRIMQEKNMALEEYLDFLRKQKSISVNVGGESYKVMYKPVARETTVQLPAGSEYEVSGNNMDGVIVTVRV